ncbi:hypothetical protein DBV05_g2262 [Lasiodiplodia theobromae]|uniref:Uncharacterized protein n=1 Tax=Lasiodiplodia theobromae TaxID=45133 RepID=A0A5N5DMJ7_9PEZI|nr:hypothetical protein DBV05_g2262 [Lasiodiplodia theobromae]
MERFLSRRATKLYKSPKSMLVQYLAIESPGFRRPPIPYLPTDWLWTWSQNVDDAFYEGLKWLSVATRKTHPTLERLAEQILQQGLREALPERSQQIYHPADRGKFVVSGEEDHLALMARAAGVSVAIAQPLGPSTNPQGLSLPPEDRPAADIAFRWLAASDQELAPPVHLGRWADNWYHLVPKKKKMLAWMDSEGVDWKLAHALLVKKGFRLDERGFITTCAYVRQVMRMGMKITDIDGAVMEMAAAAKKGLNPLKAPKECKLTPNPNAVLSLEWLDYAFQVGCNPLACLIASKYDSIALKLNEIVRLTKEDFEDEEEARIVAGHIQHLRREVNKEISAAAIRFQKLCITDEEAAAIVKQLANERAEAEQKLHTHSYTPKPVNLKAKEIKHTPRTLRKKMGFERTQETFTSSAKASARMAMAYDLVDPDDISSDSSDEEEDDESWHFLKDDLERRQDWMLQEDAMQYQNDDDWVDQTTEQNLAAYV